MSTAAVKVEHLTHRYPGSEEAALQDLALTIPAGTIIGLLGPNASGKTTLARVIAGTLLPNTGAVAVFGNSVRQGSGAPAAAETILVGEDDSMADIRLKEVLAWASLRPTWDSAEANRLLQVFGIPVRKTLKKLSRGKRSAFFAVLGLASGAALTIFDEVQVGMDVPTRYTFYQELLAAYGEGKRTFIISSHLVSELEGLVEDVVVLRNGKLVFFDSADELRTRFTTVTGAQEVVKKLTARYEIVAQRDLGPTREVTIAENLAPATKASWRDAGVTFAPASLQDAFLRLIGKEEK